MSRYDIFISYAREDAAWVRANLYEPLLRCKTADGQRPSIFIDTEEIDIGDPWAPRLVEGIQQARHFIPVYTHIYFTKPMCNWELHLAWQRSPVGAHKIILPLLLDPATQVPPMYQLIQYTRTDKQGWFKELCNQMNISPSTQESVIRFSTQPRDVIENHTLPKLVVDVYVNEQLAEEPTLVTINTANGRLQGQKARDTVDGRAIFDDLSISEFTGETHLIANADGCKPVESAAFTVTPPPPVITILPPINEKPIISTEPPLFLKDSATLVVFEGKNIMFYTIDKQPLFSTPVAYQGTYPIRLMRTTTTSLYLVDWKGYIQVIHNDGGTTSWQLKGENGRWCIVTELITTNDKVYAALWNGSVYALEAGNPLKPVLIHEGGVQVIVLYSGCFYLCDFDGNLVVYDGDKRLAAVRLEPSITSLHLCGDYLIAIGDQKHYQIVPDTLQVLSARHQDAVELNESLATIAGSLGGTQVITLVDADGRGFQFNNEFVIQSVFHTAKNTAPCAADEAGKYCILKGMGNSYSLLVDGKIVFSTADEDLAVSPNGLYFLISNPSGVQILTKSHFETLVQGDMKDER